MCGTCKLRWCACANSDSVGPPCPPPLPSPFACAVPVRTLFKTTRELLHRRQGLRMAPSGRSTVYNTCTARHVRASCWRHLRVQVALGAGPNPFWHAKLQDLPLASEALELRFKVRGWHLCGAWVVQGDACTTTWRRYAHVCCSSLLACVSINVCVCVHVCWSSLLACVSSNVCVCVHVCCSSLLACVSINVCVCVHVCWSSLLACMCINVCM